MTMADCPKLDVICVPGGPGVGALMEDEETLAFLREKARTAKYVTSVCTGSLVLGAAGLLKGKRATSHWMSRPLLKSLGAVPVAAMREAVREGRALPQEYHRLFGLWFAFGHAHHGLTLGPVSGRLLAEMMTGETPFTDPAPYRAERFG